MIAGMIYLPWLFEGSLVVAVVVDVIDCYLRIFSKVVGFSLRNTQYPLKIFGKGHSIP